MTRAEQKREARFFAGVYGWIVGAMAGVILSIVEAVNHFDRDITTGHVILICSFTAAVVTAKCNPK